MKTNDEIIEYCQFELEILKMFRMLGGRTETERQTQNAQYETYQKIINFIKGENES